MPRIVVRHLGDSSRAGQEQAFAGAAVRLGRRPGNDVVFDAARDLSVSGHHARLYLVDGKLHLERMEGWGERRRATTAQATFKEGWIGRISSYELERVPWRRARLIQHSASVSGGTSGSPLFLADGTVVAVNNAGLDRVVLVQEADGQVRAQRTPSAAQISFAIRADELRDLLVRSGW